MKIAFDSRATTDTRGVGRYVRCVLDALHTTKVDEDEIVETHHPRRVGVYHAPWLPGALVDVWQADEAGAYADDRYRAKQRAGADGGYEFQTTKPGNYLNGSQYRPAHIHLKASAPGHRSLTTQLYFPDDPYNDIDPWFDAARLVSMESPSAARFDVILAPT